MWALSHETAKVSEEVSRKAENALGAVFAQQESLFFDEEILKSSLKDVLESLPDASLSKDETIAVLGIGGSSLGAQALIQAVQPDLLEQGRVLFFDNVDAVSFHRKLARCHLDQTRWVIVSKSGGTLETLTQLSFISQQYESQKTFAQRCVVVSEDKSSALVDWAREHDAALISMPKSVGGRFSVLTSVGLVPARLAGLDVASFTQGALNLLKMKDAAQNILAHIIQASEQGCQSYYLFQYVDDLSYFGAWLQQLWAESLGKSSLKDSVEEAPHLGQLTLLRGATDQHSVLQQLMEGPFKKMAFFVETEDGYEAGSKLNTTLFPQLHMQDKSIGHMLRCEFQGTRKALEEQGVGSVTLTTNHLDEAALGQMFLLWEMVVAGFGFYAKINPFDQPGVEASKVIAKKILVAQSST